MDGIHGCARCGDTGVVVDTTELGGIERRRCSCRGEPFMGTPSALAPPASRVLRNRAGGSASIHAVLHGGAAEEMEGGR